MMIVKLIRYTNNFKCSIIKEILHYYTFFNFLEMNVYHPNPLRQPTDSLSHHCWDAILGH